MSSISRNDLRKTNTFICNGDIPIISKELTKQGSPMTTASPSQNYNFKIGQEASYTRKKSFIPLKDSFRVSSRKSKFLSKKQPSLSISIKKKTNNEQPLNKDTYLTKCVETPSMLSSRANPDFLMSAFTIVNASKTQIDFLHAQIAKPIRINKPRTRNLSICNSSLISIDYLKVKPENKEKEIQRPVIELMNSKRGIKRIMAEQDEINSQNLKSNEGELLQCEYCGDIFKTGQALGGHMSRKHAGKSLKYNHKRLIREKREFERMKLYAAKRKYFEKLGYDYEEMARTKEGKSMAKSMINRTQVKKIKSTLSTNEVFHYFK